MTETFKILGQLRSTGTGMTTLYTVPTNYSCTLSSIIICNTSSTPTSFRISIAQNGAVDNLAQYIYYDQVISGNSTFAATLGLTLGTGDVIRVYSTLATLSFSVFGVEVI